MVNLLRQFALKLLETCALNYYFYLIVAFNSRSLSLFQRPVRDKFPSKSEITRRAFKTLHLIATIILWAKNCLNIRSFEPTEKIKKIIILKFDENSNLQSSFKTLWNKMKALSLLVPYTCTADVAIPQQICLAEEPTSFARSASNTSL